MKSGLYACAGASATASAAACAKRFDEPITNESKVYFGLIPAASGRGSGGGTSARGASGTDGPAPAPTATGTAASARPTRRCTRRSDPVASFTAARISSRKWPSIHSRVKSFGTARTNVSASSSAPATSPNQVWKVVSLSAPCTRAATSSHRPSALNSIGCSTAPWLRFLGVGRRQYQPPAAGFNEEFSAPRGRQNPPFAAQKHSPHNSPQLWTSPRGGCSSSV